MVKMDKDLLVHSFEYHEYLGTDRYHNPQYADAVTVDSVRIDYTKVYSRNKEEKKLIASAVIFCYAGLTKPFKDFKEQSKVVFDGKEHTIEQVIPITQPFSSELFSYEIEVL